MKSFVTSRTESPAPIGVSGPPIPVGVFHMPSTTGVVPLQWKVARRPETCGNRPVAIAELQTGENPFRNACRSWAPVSVRIIVRLPNGSTANISPQVISHGRFTGARRRADEVLPQPTGVGVRRVDAGVLLAHRVGDHVAHLRLVQPRRVAQDVVGLRADHLVAQHRGLRRSRRR